MYSYRTNALNQLCVVLKSRLQCIPCLNIKELFIAVGLQFQDTLCPLGVS
jgi:hypothetical protein